MVSFASDYITGCHEKILQRLQETNQEPAAGYGMDAYTASATEKIRRACGCPKAEVFYLVGGTQTNAVVISAMLSSWQGVLAAATGHVNVHEAGAIEYTGHKVLALPAHDGLIDPGELQQWIRDFYADGNYEHMVFPGMVYLSYPSEYGTLYTREQLMQIHEICGEYHIPVYIDGARLGYGLMSRACDLTLPQLAELCDVFYIGGTKVGALCGEAVVFPRGEAPEHFYTTIKTHGAMLAKGKLLGIQFDTLFTDDLYFQISRHAIEMAECMKEIIRRSGIPFASQSPTNQQYLLVTDPQMECLAKRIEFSFWEKADRTHTVIRLVTCWSTTEEDLAELEIALKEAAEIA